MPLGIIAALAGALLWGFSGACAQILLSEYGASPWFITAVRTAVAALLLMAVSVARYRAALVEIFRCRALWARLGLFGIGLFLSQCTFAISVSHTNAGTATVLQSLAMVFVMLIACGVARRLPKGFEAIGLVCALASTWLIATQGDAGSLALAPAGLGWGIVNAAAVTVYIMVPRPLYERWPSIPVISCGLLVAFVVALIAFGVNWTIAGDAAVAVSAMPLDAGAWLVLVLGVGVLGTACAFGLYLYGVAIVGSVRGSLLGAAEPASAMVLTAFWLGTAVSPADWLGLLLMIAMIVFVTLSPAQDPRKE